MANPSNMMESESGDSPVTRAFVSGLPPSTTTEQLRSHFSTKFTVTDAHVVPDRRIGFLGFVDHASAQSAVKYFNRSFVKMSRIAVSLARPVELKRMLLDKPPPFRSVGRGPKRIAKITNQRSGNGKHTTTAKSLDSKVLTLTRRRQIRKTPQIRQMRRPEKYWTVRTILKYSPRMLRWPTVTGFVGRRVDYWISWRRVTGTRMLLQYPRNRVHMRRETHSRRRPRRISQITQPTTGSTNRRPYPFPTLDCSSAICLSMLPRIPYGQHSLRSGGYLK